MEQENQELSKNAQERFDRLASVNKRKTKKIIVWIIVVLIVAGGVYWLISLAQKAAGNRVGEAVAELGRDHIAPGQPAEYNSNPPTSGSHFAQPADWGVYREEIPDGAAIHNLEHGGIWISYKNIDDEIRAKIEEVGKKFPGSVIVSPREQNDAPIVLASWARILKLDSFDEKLIIDYIKTNKNKSPEPIAR